LITAILSFTVQAFFCWRIWTIRKSLWPIVVVILLVCFSRMQAFNAVTECPLGVSYANRMRLGRHSRCQSP
jgi:multidrug transporter EmrE-like cation transporter